MGKPGMTDERQINIFINKFVKELEEENAAIFAGAGLSVSAGFVNWRELLAPIAHELELDINVENDLVMVAQYHLNERQNRTALSQALIDRFSEGHLATENHKILARLPIKTYWTTNYDKLIEESLRAAGKVADVKYDIDQLKFTKPKRDAIVYKMHGDVEHPDKAVLTKDDYEKYPLIRGPFITALSGDLVSKSFLFLGFSFTDPNLDYILSRVRISLHEKPREHFCILKRVTKEEGITDEAFRYAEIKQALAIGDLKRFGVQTLLVNTYSEITTILQRIEERFKQKTIFISGSAHHFGDIEQPKAEEFIGALSQNLIRSGFRIVSGFGFGVGSHVITGALDEIYMNQRQRMHDQLLLRPFPQGEKGQAKWEEYRRDMISYAGIALFMFGNKIDSEGKVVSANGMRSEFNIAHEKGLKLIPIGATGFMAYELWSEMNANLEAFYPGASEEFKAKFAALNGPAADLPGIVKAVIDLLAVINRS